MLFQVAVNAVKVATMMKKMVKIYNAEVEVQVQSLMDGKTSKICRQTESLVLSLIYFIILLNIFYSQYKPVTREVV